MQWGNNQPKCATECTMEDCGGIVIATMIQDESVDWDLSEQGLGEPPVQLRVIMRVNHRGKSFHEGRISRMLGAE